MRSVKFPANDFCLIRDIYIARKCSRCFASACINLIFEKFMKQMAYQIGSNKCEIRRLHLRMNSVWNFERLLSIGRECSPPVKDRKKRRTWWIQAQLRLRDFNCKALYNLYFLAASFYRILLRYGCYVITNYEAKIPTVDCLLIKRNYSMPILRIEKLWKKLTIILFIT